MIYEYIYDNEIKMLINSNLNAKYIKIIMCYYYVF